MSEFTFDEKCSYASGISRRDFGRMSTTAAAIAAGSTIPLLNGCWNGGTKDKEPVLKIGYIPILDASPLLVGYAKGFFQEQGIKVEKPKLIRGWSQISEAFLSGSFNLVHLLFPIPIYMKFAQKHPVRVVGWDHMYGSGLTVGLDTGVSQLDDLAGKQIAVPYWYSIHNIILQQWLREYGINAVMQDSQKPLEKGQTNLVVMAPPDMPTAMSGGSIDGYIVAEPFNAVGEVKAKGKIVRFTGDSFKNHPCCVAAMHERDLETHPEWSQRVLNALVKSQAWLSENREEAAELLSRDGDGFIPFPKEIVDRALNKYDEEEYGIGVGTGAIKHPEWDVKRFNAQPYPFKSATREIVKLMKRTKVEGDSKFLRDLDPEIVIDELFDYDFVTKAIEENGGLAQFDGIDPDNPFERRETISIR